MAYSRTTRAPSTATRPQSTPTFSSVVKRSDDGTPLCSDGEPCIRLECKNGNNRGRFFFKCNLEKKCRFFKWEDELPPSAKAGTRTPTMSKSNGKFTGGGHLLGGSSSQTSSSQNSMSSTSSTELSNAPPPPPSNSSSPLKRRRMSWDYREEDDISRNTTPVLEIATTSHKASSSRAPPPQSAEAAILEDWDEDIEDFDDFESGIKSHLNESPTKSPTNKKSKFVSFNGNGHPITPKKEQEGTFESNSTEGPLRTPQRLAPGLPVTPKSVDNNPTYPTRGLGVEPDKWQQILNDPASPFHARRNALLGGAGPASSSSPTSADTTPLLSHAGRSDLNSIPPTSTHSSHVRSLSDLVQRFNATAQDEFSIAYRAAETLERQLKAAQAKAIYHEKKEKESRTELEELKEQLRSAKKENEQLRLGWN